jgi:tyrosine-protein kinase Etk/Wzc
MTNETLETRFNEQLSAEAMESQMSDADSIDILDLLIGASKHKKLIFGFTTTVATAAIVITLLMPPIYTGSTKILPPQNQSAASGVLAQLGGLAGLAGGAIKSPTEIYVSMLKSRTVADSLISRFELLNLYKAVYPSQAREQLAEVTTILAGKDAIITIEVDDKDPKRAAALANGYVEELLKLTQVLAVTDASQRRLFFERQYAQARDNLANAEEAARHALQQGGLVKVDEQGRGMIETTARLRAQITMKEVQIGAMRTYASDQNADLRATQQELEALRRELAKVEGTGSDLAVAPGASSNRGVENLRLLRNVKYYEIIYELLGRQYELSKIDEAKESSVVQVLDRAIEPDRKSKPKRTLIVVVSTMAAFVISLLLAFVIEAITRSKSDPEAGRKMAILRQYWARSK